MSRAFATHRDQPEKLTAVNVRGIVLGIKTELVKRMDTLELMDPVPMSEVGGLENVKEYLRKRRFAMMAEAKEFGIDQLKGFMVIGPPGTGKSLIAKATGGIMELPIIRFDVSRVFASLVGASEGRIRATLKVVEAMAPIVLMFDELDKARLYPKLQSNNQSAPS